MRQLERGIHEKDSLGQGNLEQGNLERFSESSQ
jgi:hypothetical protein